MRGLISWGSYRDLTMGVELGMRGLISWGSYRDLTLGVELGMRGLISWGSYRDLTLGWSSECGVWYPGVAQGPDLGGGARNAGSDILS